MWNHIARHLIVSIKGSPHDNVNDISSVVISALYDERRAAEHLCWKPSASTQTTLEKLGWGWGVNHLVGCNTRVFLTFYRTSSTIGLVSGVTNWFCTLKETEPTVIYKGRKIKIRHQFTAGYSWYVLSVSVSSRDKQSEGWTNTLTRYRCCFHAQNQQNRLRDRAAKCQTTAKEQNCCCCCFWWAVCF